MEQIKSIQHPNQNNVNNFSKAGRHFRNKKREYLKAKINELETHSKNKNIREMYREINDLMKDYQPRNYIVKD
jgi:hypothetical protein